MDSVFKKHAAVTESKPDNASNSIANTINDRPDLTSVFKEEVEEQTKVQESSASLPLEDLEDPPINKIETKTQAPITEFLYRIDFTSPRDPNKNLCIFCREIQISDKSSITVFDAFAFKLFRERILRQEITMPCRKDLSSTSFAIPLTSKVAIQYIKAESWMNQTEEETKKVFDERVLQVYRQTLSDANQNNSSQLLDL